MSEPVPAIDDPEFIAELAGLYRDCERLAISAETVLAGAQRRVSAIRRNGYLRLAELGEKLLAVQAARPAEFETWFAVHQMSLGFSLRTAYRCTTAARLVLEHGLEKALLIAFGQATPTERPEPFLSLSLRLAVAPTDVPSEEIPAWLERLRPVAEVYHALEQRAASGT